MGNSKPHHNGMMQLSQELAAAKQRIAELEKQRDALVDIFGDVREIHGYKYQYLITSRGFIFSFATGRMKQLTPSLRGKHRNQYLFVKLERDGTLENVPIHRLVADSFLGEKPSPLHCINHKDGDKQNNDAKNLEWATISENITHAYHHGLAGGIKHGSFKGPVCSSDGNGFGYVFFGLNQAKSLGFTPQLVSRCIAGKKDTHKGHSFYRMSNVSECEYANKLRGGGV